MPTAATSNVRNDRMFYSGKQRARFGDFDTRGAGMPGRAGRRLCEEINQPGFQAILGAQDLQAVFVDRRLQ
jgi:hypothetical protein